MGELGYPDFVVFGYIGLWAPRDTPKEVVARLYDSVKEALTRPNMRELFATLGAATGPNAAGRVCALPGTRFRHPAALGARTRRHPKISGVRSLPVSDPAPSPELRALLEKISLRRQKVISHRTAGIIGGTLAQHVADRAVMGHRPASFLGRDGCKPQSLPIT